ncbi:hypothetical protein SE17_34165 [Kouleothrix aurantiaca]|uniref:HD domain-containing protein n=1 Tax=Kouleothrix aurantiaca TaxID=186479 RepID=A0A0P9D9H7_9CHLR|nr:hypothetical protein SE17_34165 [Kouleothrix aurantiaca]
MLRSVFYRLRQFAAALAARLSAADRALLAQTLAPAELALFMQMPRYDQRHCLDVCLTLRAAGHADPLLLRAALLHDCGKVDDDGRPLPLFYYGLFVVMQRLAPGLYRRAARNGRGPLRWFALHAAHDERSAAMAARAGSPPALVEILRDYGARRATPATLALGWADRQN